MANQKQIAKAAAKQAQQQELKRKRKMNLIAAAAALLLIICGAVILGVANKPEPKPQPGPVVPTHSVTIEVQDYGTITAELYGKTAPITVDNFVRLANEGFYDGLTFHRVISGFMIQGGDPNGDGTGGSAENIQGEFAKNGWDNPIAHERGVLSMARSNAYDSASSQFFIVHGQASHLDGQYASFGRVLTGLEIVDAICEKTPVIDNNGSVARANQPVITSIRVTGVGEE